MLITNMFILYTVYIFLITHTDDFLSMGTRIVIIMNYHKIRHLFSAYDTIVYMTLSDSDIYGDNTHIIGPSY